MVKKEQKTSILVVDDEQIVREMIRDLLEEQGYRVHQAVTGLEGLDILSRFHPHVVLLDIMLPGIDGFQVCERMRSLSDVPIIMVTAKGEDEDKVTGITAGADDYLIKPFSVMELLARVKAALRRPTLARDATLSVYAYQGLMIDFNQRKVTLEGEQVRLTAAEYDILSFLAQNAGRIVARDEILMAVWGQDQVENYHILQVNIDRLRRKLGEQYGSRKYILTQSGKGYFFPKEAHQNNIAPNTIIEP